MNNEEKNLNPETEGVEENKPVTEESATANKLSGGMLAAIIGGAVVVILAIVLLIVLLPGSGNDNSGGDDEGTSDVGGDTQTKVTYSVKVVDQNGDPVKDAMINFYPEGGTSFFYLTDKDGKTEGYRTDKKVSASVSVVPDGYEYDKIGQKLSFDKDGNLVITVTKLAEEKTEYLIRVIDQNGNPVVGAKIQICVPYGSCAILENVTADANGEVLNAIKEVEGYEAQIASLPDGYTDPSNGSYHPFEGNSDDGYTVVIEVVKN